MKTDEAARENLAEFGEAFGGGHVVGVERVQKWIALRIACAINLTTNFVSGACGST